MLKYNKILNLILIILIIAILGICGYFGYQHYQKYKTQKETSEILEEFDKLIIELAEENNNSNTEQPPIQQQGMRGISTNALYYKGYKVIGKIEMPSVNLQYPVLDIITNAKAIDYSVAMQYGAGINKIGNTIIIGHNTYNGTMFGKNKLMKIGDVIYLTDLEGTRIEYEIYNKYITSQEDYSYSGRNTNGNREVTLVTCDNNSKNRLVIYAREVKK